MTRRLLVCFLVWAATGALAGDYRLTPQAVAPDVYVFVGANEDFDNRNGGNIVNTGFIVGPAGVIVIDTGPSRAYGQQMRAAIARVTAQPVVLVINTHFHPDHFLGNQAFADVPIGALAGTAEGISRDGNAFAENLYRMSGAWMKGTEVLPPRRPLTAGALAVAGRSLRLLAFDGHTGADLVVVDDASGVVFAGDLVFNDRAPTTPHADLAHWRAALDGLQGLTGAPGFRALVPGHGAVSRDDTPLHRTRAWLDWLDGTLHRAAADGLEMNEVLALPLPPAFADLPLAAHEYRRSVEHLFPAIEAAALPGSRR